MYLCQGVWKLSYGGKYGQQKCDASERFLASSANTISLMRKSAASLCNVQVSTVICWPKRRKLRWYGHLRRLDECSKIIFQRAVTVEEVGGEANQRKGKPTASCVVQEELCHNSGYCKQQPPEVKVDGSIFIMIMPSSS